MRLYEQLAEECMALIDTADWPQKQLLEGQFEQEQSFEQNNQQNEQFGERQSKKRNEQLGERQQNAQPNKLFNEQFNQLALRLFSYQFQHNSTFQAFCRQKGKTPRTVRDWMDIPAVPLQAFKQANLSCTDPQQAEALFMTSGTTNQELRGKHYHPNLRLYNASMKAAFQHNVIGTDRMKMIVLFPTEQQLPHSSLAHYLHVAVKEFGEQGSQYVVNEQGIDADKLIALLKQAQDQQEPILVLGATFSFVHALELLRQQGLKFNLPIGSKLMDTGGTKGRSREIDQEQLYEECAELLGIPRMNCINMYGMTELSTQFYDNGYMKKLGEKFGPPWIRTRAVNPLTGEDMPLGQTGVLVHCDLANVNSVTTILTEDVGYMTETGGFVLLGRAAGVEAKGCSLAMEEFVQASSLQL